MSAGENRRAMGKLPSSVAAGVLLGRSDQAVRDGQDI